MPVVGVRRQWLLIFREDSGKRCYDIVFGRVSGQNFSPSGCLAQESWSPGRWGWDSGWGGLSKQSFVWTLRRSAWLSVAVRNCEEEWKAHQHWRVEGCLESWEVTWRTEPIKQDTAGCRFSGRSGDLGQGQSHFRALNQELLRSLPWMLSCDVYLECLYLRKFPPNGGFKMNGGFNLADLHLVRWLIVITLDSLEWDSLSASKVEKDSAPADCSLPWKHTRFIIWSPNLISWYSAAFHTQ